MPIQQSVDILGTGEGGKDKDAKRKGGKKKKRGGRAVEGWLARVWLNFGSGKV